MTDYNLTLDAQLILNFVKHNSGCRLYDVIVYMSRTLGWNRFHSSDVLCELRYKRRTRLEIFPYRNPDVPQLKGYARIFAIV
jgi:hypothetical protein